MRTFPIVGGLSRLFVAACIAFAIESTSADVGGQRLYRIESISSDGTVTIAVYERLDGLLTERVSGLEIWPDAANGRATINHLSWQKPDVPQWLLSAGMARLPDASQASRSLVETEDRARRQGQGQWHSSYASLQSRLSPVGKLAAFILLCFSVPELINLWKGFQRRNMVRLALVGLPAVGKSWIWARLGNPNVPIQELEQIQRTQRANEGQFPELNYRGMRLVPTCVDLPGENMGDQLNELFVEKKVFHLLQRAFFPQKAVWLIVLASTRNPRVYIHNSISEKIDGSFVSEQLGFLSLPRGILEAKRTHLPKLVIVCLSKADLFSTSPSTDATNNSTDAKSIEIFYGLFQQHIQSLDRACRERGVETVTLSCSARNGWAWGFSYLDRILSEKAFS